MTHSVPMNHSVPDLNAPLTQGDWVNEKDLPDVHRIADVDGVPGQVGLVTPDMWRDGDTADPAYVGVNEVTRNGLHTILPPLDHE